jgi:hypothetical protein
MVVQDKDCSCTSGIYMTYHDTDRYRKPLSEILASFPVGSNSYYGWRISGTY